MATSAPVDPAATAPATADTAGRSNMSILSLAGFSVGMIGDRIFRDAPALLLLLFMTNYLAIPPAIAGTAIFVPKLLIVFVDPLVGSWSDRLDTRWGRRKPLMFAGALLASAAIVLFFHVPRFDSVMAQAVYMSFIIFVGFTGYSLYSVPYLVMASEIGSGDDERRKVMSWRVVFMAIGLSISAFAGGFMEWIGGGDAGYSTMSWVYASICLVTMLATVFAAPTIKTVSVPSLSLAAQFQVIRSSRRYLRLLTVGFLQKLGEGVGFGSFAYFCIYVALQPLTSIGLVVLAATAGQIIAQPFWLRASRRYAPTTLYTIAVLGWCLNLLLWLAMRGQSTWWLLPLGLQAGLAAGGLLMVTLSMLSNVLAADAAETGVNREGIFSGMWLATEKLAFALGSLIVGVILGIFGFVESAHGQAVEQTDLAIVGIAITYCGVSMFVYLLSILAVRRFGRFEIVQH